MLLELAAAAALLFFRNFCVLCSNWSGRGGTWVINVCVGGYRWGWGVVVVGDGGGHEHATSVAGCAEAVLPLLPPPPPPPLLLLLSE